MRKLQQCTKIAWRKKKVHNVSLLGNQKLEPKLLGIQMFWFRYSSPFCRPEISGTQTEISLGLGSRTMNTPTEYVAAYLYVLLNYDEVKL